jgi:hypothetical protein
VSTRTFTLAAWVSTEHPAGVRKALRGLLPAASIARAGDEFVVTATMRGASARDLNRALLSALRRVERRTRLRAEWTSRGKAERFFDYVPKGSRTT